MKKVLWQVHRRDGGRPSTPLPEDLVKRLVGLLSEKYGADTHYARPSDVGLNPCHHCGTVGSALTVWDPSKVEGCTCPCHTVRRPKLASNPRKQAAPKSKRPLRNTRKELLSNAQE